MKLMEFLNEYEMDYAQAAYRDEGLQFASMREKKIVVFGDRNPDFAKAIIYSALYLNDEKNLQLEVKYVSARGEGEKGFEKLCNNRTDFSVGRTEALAWADLVIMTGLCNQKIPKTMEFFMETVGVYEQALSYGKPVIFLSDYRVFGHVKKDYIASEFEQPDFDFDDGNNLDIQLLLTLESLTAIYGKQKSFSYHILRCAMAAGAFVDFGGNLLYELAKAVSEGENKRIFRSRNKYSFVYVNDIIRAVYYSILKLPENTIYHICGKESCVTTGTLIEYLYQNFPDKTKIVLEYTEEDPEYGIALNDDKMRIFGFQPKVTVEDAIILLVKSYDTGGDIFVFDGSYQGKLDTIHDILLTYLKEVDRICKKHHIKYFLAGGTLLGAIRHHGFIPWDDDADVMMLREDYEKFLKVAPCELPAYLKIQLPETERGNHNVFTKLRMDNTLFATKFTGQFPAMHNGIFIDILSHDQTGNHKWSQKMHLLATLGTRSMVYHKWDNSPIDTEGFPKPLIGIANFMKKHCSMKFLEWMQKKAFTFFSKSRKSRYLYDGMGRNLKRGSFPKEWLNEAVYVDFENCKFPVPKEYDKYLTYLYGDYMQMIPVSERRMSHSIVWFDLGEYTNFKLK